jgi:hypothetical protein
MNNWAVRLSGQVIWTEGGKEVRFKTEQEAEQALIDEMEECAKAYKLGYMEDEGDFDNYRIVEV